MARLLLPLVLALSGPARAVLFYETADPSHNTAAPTGASAGSGWQYQGFFGNFLGTAISSSHFSDPNPVPSSFFSSRISTRSSQIAAAIPEPTAAVLVSAAAGLRLRRRRAGRC